MIRLISRICGSDKYKILGVDQYPLFVLALAITGLFNFNFFLNDNPMNICYEKINKGFFVCQQL